jgi:MFS family permease
MSSGSTDRVFTRGISHVVTEVAARPRPDPDIGTAGSTRAWAEPNFRVYWISHGLMLLATQTNLLATQWLVLDQTASRTMLGVVPLIQGLVVAAFSAFGDIAADRLPRRDLLAVGRWLAMLVVLALAALAWLGVIQYWHGFIGVGLTALILAIVQPATQTYVYDLVGRGRLLNAVAMTSAATSLFQVAGPALSAVLLSLAGVTGNYLLAGAALALGALLLTRMPIRGTTTATPVHTNKSWAVSLVADFATGVRAARGTPVIAWLLLMSFANVLAAAVLILRPVFARDVLNVGAAGFGILGAAFGAGSVVATIVILLIKPVRRLGLLLFGSMIVWDMVTIAYGISHSFPLTLGCEFILGAVGPVWSTAMMTMLQIEAPAVQRGRIMSLYFLVMQAVFVGQFGAGVLADHIDVTATMIAARAFRLVLLLILLCVAVPVRRFALQGDV